MSDLVYSMLEPFLCGSSYSESSDDVQVFRRWALSNRSAIKRALRLTVNDSHSGVNIANKVLRKLGYEIDSRRIGPRGERVRWYRISNAAAIDRDLVLADLITALNKHSDKKNSSKSKIESLEAEVRLLRSLLGGSESDSPYSGLTAPTEDEMKRLFTLLA